jgi:hypothetical protein
MDFSGSLAAWGTGTFDEAVRSDLVRHQLALPLERSCHNGAWPGDVSSVAVSEVMLSDSLLQVIVTVHFVEVLPSACRSANYDQACTLWVDIDRKTGSGGVDYMGDYYSAG